MEHPNRYRTIWLSDVHLGTRECKAAFLLDFLRRNESEYLYLVGDLVDGWALRRSWYWDQPHNDVVQKILRKARKGTAVTYIPGNHDAFARDYAGLQFGHIQVALHCIHTTADGRRLLILHGDTFDGVVGCARWLSVLGAEAYQVALKLNRWFNQGRRWLGLPYWSLSAYLKHKTKRAVQFIASFEAAVVQAIDAHAVDGIVCGHIHHAEIRAVDGRLYANTGDWVESCTALAEHFDGRLELIRWALAEHPARSVNRIGGDGRTGWMPPVLSTPHG